LNVSAGASPSQSFDDLGQTAAGDELHGIEMHSTLGAHGVHWHDIGVLQRGGGAGFVFEALQLPLVEHASQGKDLEGNATAERELFGLVDDAHPTAADLAENTKITQLARRRLPLVLRRVETSLAQLGDRGHGRNQFLQGLSVLSMFATERLQVEAFAGQKPGGDLFEQTTQLDVE
jgi:hypothetical protein